MIRTKSSAYVEIPESSGYIGDQNGPSISGSAEIVTGRDAIWRVYHAYWKTHPLIMAFIAFATRRRIRNRKEVLVRVRPDEPDPLAGVTDPVVRLFRLFPIEAT